MYRITLELGRKRHIARRAQRPKKNAKQQSHGRWPSGHPEIITMRPDSWQRTTLLYRQGASYDAAPGPSPCSRAGGQTQHCCTRHSAPSNTTLGLSPRTRTDGRAHRRFTRNKACSNATQWSSPRSRASDSKGHHSTAHVALCNNTSHDPTSTPSATGALAPC